MEYYNSAGPWWELMNVHKWFLLLPSEPVCSLEHQEVPTPACFVTILLQWPLNRDVNPASTDDQVVLHLTHVAAQYRSLAACGCSSSSAHSSCQGGVLLSTFLNRAALRPQGSGLVSAHGLYMQTVCCTACTFTETKFTPVKVKIFLETMFRIPSIKAKAASGLQSIYCSISSSQFALTSARGSHQLSISSVHHRHCL